VKHIRDILAFARDLGVVDARIEQGGKHPHLVGTTPNGKPLCYVLPGSPGDGRRGQRNTEAALRRACRAATADDGQQPKAGERRRRRRPSHRRRPPNRPGGDPRLAADGRSRGGAMTASTSPFDTPAMRALMQSLLLANRAQGDAPALEAA
jgi:hypothetical protein